MSFKYEVIIDVIVHLHGWYTAMVAKLLKEVYAAPRPQIVYTMHVDNTDSGTFPKSRFEGIGLKIPSISKYLSCKAEGITASDSVVAVSEALSRDCAEGTSLSAKTFRYAQFCGKVISIRNGINFNKYCPTGKQLQISSCGASVMFNSDNVQLSKNAVKAKLLERGGPFVGMRSGWSLAPGLPVVLFLARYSDEKGTSMLNAAVKACDGKANLIAIGRGIDDHSFSMFCEHSNVKNNVLLIFDEATQVKYGEALRACADIQLVPSHKESCGLVVMESLANVAMIVASHVGGLIDLVQDFSEDRSSGNGRHFASGNESSLNKALNLAIEDVQADGAAISQRLYGESKRFNWQGKGGPSEKYHKLYIDLLGSAPPAPEQDQNIKVGSCVFRSSSPC